MTYRGALKELSIIKNYPSFPAELIPSMDKTIETFEEEWDNRAVGTEVECNVSTCKHNKDDRCTKRRISISGCSNGR